MKLLPIVALALFAPFDSDLRVLALGKQEQPKEIKSPLSPEDSIKEFKLRPGLKIELVAAEREKTPEIACEVQGLRVGPLGIATNGSEYFVDYALRIKQSSPHKFTWFVELANEYIGYVPTAQAFVGGGYEPRTARSSKLAPEGGQKLVEGALRALNAVAPK